MRRRLGRDGEGDAEAPASGSAHIESAEVALDGDDGAEEVRIAGCAEESNEARRPRIACDPGRPTRQEFLDHRCTHWPFRSWCKHCVRGRAVCSPHRKKSQEAKDFAQDGRVPTLSIDHCFLGSEEEAAAANPFLIAYDGCTGALFAVAVATKEHEDWLADDLEAALDELGYGGCRVAIKCDNARELLKLREAISARRTAPTVPITVPIKESRGNGAVERAVRTWQGQFRTLKDHAEFELGAEFGPRHPMLTWCAWWSAALLNRVKVQESGRTAYELYTGHLAKVTMAAYGEKVLWRLPRAVSGAGKYDSEWQEGVFVGISGPQVIISTPQGIKLSRDVRRLADGEGLDKPFVD